MFFKWYNGRQTATKEIKKLLLWNKKWFDFYILYFPRNKNIDWHFDTVENKNHHRINITIWGLWRFWFKNKNHIEYFEWQFPIKYKKFRPDITEHKAEVFKNSIVISIGWVTNKI